MAEIKRRELKAPLSVHYEFISSCIRSGKILHAKFYSVR